jgi:hypothetical protein
MISEFTNSLLFFVVEIKRVWTVRPVPLQTSQWMQNFLGIAIKKMRFYFHFKIYIFCDSFSLYSILVGTHWECTNIRLTFPFILILLLSLIVSGPRFETRAYFVACRRANTITSLGWTATAPRQEVHSFPLGQGGGQEDDPHRGRHHQHR